MYDLVNRTDGSTNKTVVKWRTATVLLGVRDHPDQSPTQLVCWQAHCGKGASLRFLGRVWAVTAQDARTKVVESLIRRGIGCNRFDIRVWRVDLTNSWYGNWPAHY